MLLIIAVNPPPCMCVFTAMAPQSARVLLIHNKDILQMADIGLARP